MSPATGYLILGGWLLVMVVIAYWIYRVQSVTTISEFVTAGGTAGVGIVTASFVATWMWAADILGAPQTVFEVGLTGIWMYGAPAFWSALLVIPVAIRLRRIFPRAFTYSEFFLYRFENRLPHVLAMLVILFTMAMASVLQVIVGGVVIGALTGIDARVVMAIILGGIGLYILLGGLWASMATDFIQFASSAIVLLIIVPFLVFRAGGPAAVYQDAVANVGADPFFSFSNLAVWKDYFLPFILGWGFWAIVALESWQRAFAVRRDRISRVFTFGAIGLFSTIPMYAMIAVIGMARFPDAPSTDITPVVLSELLPAAAAVIFTIVLLALLGSSTDSYINAIASLAARDLYADTLAPRSTDRQQLGVARVAALLAAAGSFVLSVWLLDADFLQLLFVGAIGITALAGPFVISLFWARVTAVAFSVGVAVSLVVSAIGLARGLPLWQVMLVGHLVANGLVVLLSLTQRKEFDFSILERIGEERPTALEEAP